VPLARGVWAGRLPDDWAAALAAHAASVRADATRPLCLWLDDSSRVPQEVVVDELMRAAAAEGLDLRSEGDVTLTVAPFDHIPWEQVEVVLDDLGPAPVGRVALRGLAGVG
jgi:hypothetical protein